MAKSNDFENKKKKENKEMSTGTFPPVSLTCKHQKIMYISNCMSSVQKTTSHQLLIFNI